MNIGQKVRELRIAKNLTQEELADRSELSKGFISQLERDLTSPSIATLVDILQCLGTNLNEFFSDDEEEQVVFGDEDYFEKKDTDLKNTIEWIIPNAQRNMMEPIRLTLAPGGATYPDLPHEGEEFGYVLQGSVKIHVKLYLSSSFFTSLAVLAWISILIAARKSVSDFCPSSPSKRLLTDTLPVSCSCARTTNIYGSF